MQVPLFHYQKEIKFLLYTEVKSIKIQTRSDVVGIS